MKSKSYTLLYTILLQVLLISCSKNEPAEKSDFGIPSAISTSVMTSGNYAHNANLYVDFHRKELRQFMPQAVYEILHTYRDLLVTTEKNKIYATSTKDHENYMRVAQTKTFDSLVKKNIEINYIYSLLLKDLEHTNIRYAEKYKIPIDSFKSFYALDQIVFNEEVLIKVRELLKEDQKRSKKLTYDKNLENALDYGIIAIEKIPRLGPSLSTAGMFSKTMIKAAYKGISAAVHNKTLTKNSEPVERLAYSLIKETGTSGLSKMDKKMFIEKISNEGKVIQNIYSSSGNNVVSNYARPVRNSANALSEKFAPKQSPQVIFKVIENKLEGRIYDFSDGLMAVHLQNVRETIKFNENLISKKTITSL